ncbi:type 1 glutamine amidotransferase [Nocardia puris]|uniref:Protease I n=1 Tax=Nocardia puris TaxID=208602 RepID=A0A366DZ10_9NOCA|nr:type 1 glutamine amidotransferase domain-containing protein [Nocardia puris]MBF6209760.1 type 1 glutamine amidotransferase [Nocardia puris]MBF6366332.1 type 1 glutamine amidotransferase [Nocardia puris]MBF6458329.1 type 1 glutamine amidotransferase [Nocardia puris]RBO94504.1 protease I [Nocardia puris]
MSDKALADRRVLAIVSNYGVEQDELVVPVERLRAQGAEVTVAAVSDEAIRTLVGDRDPGQEITPDATLAAVTAVDHDLLLIPGGTLNADKLRLDVDALGIVGGFVAAGKPIAAICHGPWLLVSAGVVAGKTLTSYPSLHVDLENAGARWADEPVVVDEVRYPLITSRNPRDLDDFLPAVGHALRTASTSTA